MLRSICDAGINQVMGLQAFKTFVFLVTTSSPVSIHFWIFKYIAIGLFVSTYYCLDVLVHSPM